MKNKKKFIITAALLASCFAAIVGTTMALLTATGNIGSVNATAASKPVVSETNIKDLYASYSIKATDQTITEEYEYYAGELTGQSITALNGKYVYEEILPVQGSQDKKYNFPAGGSVELKEENHLPKIDLQNIAPGDKIDFTACATVQSNVPCKYCVQISFSEATKNGDLAGQLKYTPNSDNLDNWQDLNDCPKNGTNYTVEVDCSVYLPITVNQVFDDGVVLEISIVVVQANAIPDATTD